MKKIVIVLPTYNEALNIKKFLNAVQAELKEINNYETKILVVDDYSPDGTSEIVKEIIKTSDIIELLQKNKEGLGAAYIAGFRHAINELNADYVMEMDSDFSHNPKDIKRFVAEIENGYNFVIGSRYVKGGSIPDNWGILRKANSKYGNVFARHIAGLKDIKDCTSGFRLIDCEYLKKVDLSKIKVKGYSFQINILFELYQLNTKIKEIPINFIDRELGKSKLGTKDIIEFMLNSFILRYKSIKNMIH